MSFRLFGPFWAPYLKGHRLLLDISWKIVLFFFLTKCLRAKCHKPKMPRYRALLNIELRSLFFRKKRHSKKNQIPMCTATMSLVFKLILTDSLASAFVWKFKPIKSHQTAIIRNWELISFVCFLVRSFTSHSGIFLSYANVTITDEWLQHLTNTLQSCHWAVRILSPRSCEAFDSGLFFPT